MYVGGYGGHGGNYNEVYIGDGGEIRSPGFTLGGDGGYGNRTIVGANGKLYTSLLVGNGGSDNEFGVDGGFVVMSGARIGVNSIYHIDGFFLPSHRNRLWVKNGGTVECNGNLCIGGTAVFHTGVPAYSADASHGNTVRIEGEETVFSLTNGGHRIYIGSNHGASNRLDIAGGGTILSAWDVCVGGGQDFDVGGGTDEDGWRSSRPASNNVLRIENGTLDIQPYPTGDLWQRGLIVASGSRLEMAGTNSFVGIGKHFALVLSPVVHFELGKVAPVRQPLIEVRGALHPVVHYENYRRAFETDGTATLEIDAIGLAAAGGGRVVLMEVRKDPSVNIMDGEEVVGNVVFNDLESLVASQDWVSGSGNVVIEDGNNGFYDVWRVVAEVNNLAGTMILLR